MSVIDIAEVRRANPLEVVENVATTHQWLFERAAEDELTIVVRGKWTDYQVSFTWMYDIESLHLACAFELKVPERSHAEVERLIAMVNAQLWVGHFDLWSSDGLVMFRHSLLLAGRGTPMGASAVGCPLRLGGVVAGVLMCGVVRRGGSGAARSAQLRIGGPSVAASAKSQTGRTLRQNLAGEAEQCRWPSAGRCED